MIVAMKPRLALLLLSFLMASRLPAQTPAVAGPTAPEDGIPVTDPLVISKCGTCHTKDEKGNLARISWERATPEGWQEALKRMVRLNGVQLTPAEARTIVKYLSTYHGLAPEEANPIAYFNEHRIQDETNIPNDAVRGACVNCHAFAKALSWRRSAEDWKLLANLHVALYPQADEAFVRGLNAGNYGAPSFGSPAATQPGDEALAYLAKAAPLHTPEWGAWRARMRTPKLTGRWLVTANVLGHGKYYGEMQVEPGSGVDEFTTKVTLTSAKDGSKLIRTGTGLVYAGYAWRGRSKGTGDPGSSPDNLANEMREVLMIAPDQTQADGRWFWGLYQEFGMDVKLMRASADATLLGVDRSSLKAGSQGTRVRLVGDNLPSQIAPGDLDFGSGIIVRRVVSSTGSELIAEVDVSAGAVSGKRDISFRRSVLQGAIAVYDRVDYIKVIPEAALSRLGTDKYPKGYQQFEAIGYQRGADGKLRTADDVELGPLDVTWSVEEFYAVYGDDDKDFVGKLSPTGMFTPAAHGPNPERKFSRNNYGDVWVVATSKSEKEKDGKPMIGKAYLVVTVPIYLQWDQPEVGQ
jgi:quinohemoprotein amine dehydrogenase